MKAKLSVTIDEPLVRFLDTLPGRSRSEKLEAVIRRFRTISDDRALRKALTKHRDSNEARAEAEAWRERWNGINEVSRNASARYRLRSGRQLKEESSACSVSTADA